MKHLKFICLLIIAILEIFLAGCGKTPVINHAVLDGTEYSLGQATLYYNGYFELMGPDVKVESDGRWTGGTGICIGFELNTVDNILDGSYTGFSENASGTMDDPYCRTYLDGAITSVSINSNPDGNCTISVKGDMVSVTGIITDDGKTLVFSYEGPFLDLR